MLRELTFVCCLISAAAIGCAGDLKSEPQRGADAAVAPEFCGNGVINAGEQCDDGNKSAGDGCSDTCQTEAGWKCATPGAACVGVCGDGTIKGFEQCDDGNGAAGDGCDSECQYEPGYTCPTPGKPCSLDLCGNRQKEGGEQCDDGNHDYGDGCTPNCTAEPNCTGGACKSQCGDGYSLPGDGEDCDDGNARSGEGCSADCKVEKGYECTRKLQEVMNLPIVIRDFRAYDVSGGHPDFNHFTGDGTPGIVGPLLGSDRKPVYAHGDASTACTTGQTNFNQWYHDTAGVNMTFIQTLKLTKQTDGSYIYSNSFFFPIDGQGFGDSGKDRNGKSRNFGFTDETHYWFEYRGGERLTFTGDDDLWVFVNGHLFIDLGGLHPEQTQTKTLDDTNEAAFGLAKGNVYELAVFHAERHTDQSNYKLTLFQFNKGRSVCTSKCGDGIVTRDEACDDGKNDGSNGGCMPGCKAHAPRCGDGVAQTPAGEQCDDGINTSAYGGCGAGCKLVAYCGDGHVDPEFGEECDEGKPGASNAECSGGGGVDSKGGTCPQSSGGNTGAYGHCTKDCKAGPRCGDGVVQPEFEQCDDGNTINTDGCPNTCKVLVGPVG